MVVYVRGVGDCLLIVVLHCVIGLCCVSYVFVVWVAILPAACVWCDGGWHGAALV